MKCARCGKDIPGRVVSYLPPPPFEGVALMMVDGEPLYSLNGLPLCGPECATAIREEEKLCE